MSGQLFAFKIHFIPDEGSEGSGAQTHVALDPEEAYEQSRDALHQPQVVELFGVLGVDLLQTQRGQSSVVRALLLRLCLHGNLLPVFKPTSLRLGTLGMKRQKNKTTDFTVD